MPDGSTVLCSGLSSALACSCLCSNTFLCTFKNVGDAVYTELKFGTFLIFIDRAIW